MEFTLSEEQESLAEFVHELLEQRSTSEQIRATLTSDAPYDVELWGILCEQIGAASLAIPEAWGGSGFTTRETHIILEELGYALAPSPFLGSVAFAAQALVLAAHEDTNERVLPAIAAGETTAALAWAAADGTWNPANTAVQASEGDEVTLSGSVPLVIDGQHAEELVVIARNEAGPALFLVSDASQVAREDTPALDPTLNLATLTFTAVPATRLSAPGDDALLDTLYGHLLTALTATQVGAAKRGLDMTVEYSKQRQQFGRVIGSFQALKHRMADMHVLLETAITTSHAAAHAQAHGSAELSSLATIAKATCSDTLNHIASETIQLHGGIAITWEHDAHFVFKRAHATNQLLGTARQQRLRLEHELGLTPASA